MRKRGTRLQFRSSYLLGFARVLFHALLLAWLPAFTARAAGNIFDDDWTPPVPRATRPSSLTTAFPASQPALPVAQPHGESPLTTSPQRPIHTAPVPVPDKALQAKSRRLFKEIFAKELADHSSASRRKLALKLLEMAEKSADVPPDHFVLLVAAAEASRDAADLELTARATDALATAYHVDGLRIRSDIALAVLAMRDPAAGSEANCLVIFQLCDQLVAIDDYTTATRLLTGLRPLVTAHPPLVAQVARRAQEMDAIRAASDRAERLSDRLRSTPDDPSANLVVGQFFCFYKQDWPHGLPFLAKSSDQRMKGLAATELGRPADAEAVIRLADGWWEIANSLRDPARRHIQLHAVVLYKLVLDKSSGLRRVAIEKRIDEVANLDQPSAVNLLQFIDPQRDAIHGVWRMEQNGLLSDDGQYARFRIPYQPPEEYDFRIVFTRVEGNNDVCQLLSQGQTSFAWVMAAGNNTMMYFTTIKKLNGDTNYVQSALTTGQKTESVVKVRRDSVAAYINGKLMSQHKMDFDTDVAPGLSGAKGALGLASYSSPTRFEVIEIIEITGHGKPIPSGKQPPGRNK